MCGAFLYRLSRFLPGGAYYRQQPQKQKEEMDNHLRFLTLGNLLKAWPGWALKAKVRLALRVKPMVKKWFLKYVRRCLHTWLSNFSPFSCRLRQTNLQASYKQPGAAASLLIGMPCQPLLCAALNNFQTFASFASVSKL